MPAPIGSNPLAPSFFAGPPADPLIIDPGVDYKYVMPVNRETGISFSPVEGFTQGILGRTLTFNYSGLPLSSDTPFSLRVTAANNLGSKSQVINVRVRGGSVLQIDPSFFAACINGSNDLRFQTTSALPGSAAPINGILAVGSKIKAVELIDGTAPTGIALATVLWVVRVDDAIGRFRVSATQGGAAITPDQNATFYFEVATTINTSELVYVKDSSVFAVDQPATLTYTDGVALPTNLSGAKFVRAIVGPRYIKLGDTVGGAFIAANADSFASDHNVRLVIDSGGGRHIPAIDSASELAVTENTPIAGYDITSDIAADSYAVQGLPTGLAFDGAHTISGTPLPQLNARTAVTLIAYKGSNAFYRYLLLVKIAAVDVDLDPDVVYDIASRRFYSPSGPAGRGDRIDVSLGDAPLLFAVEQNAKDFSFPPGTTVRFGIKKNINDSAFLVSGSIVLTGAQSLLSVGEDWADGAFTALFNAAQKFLDLWAWFDWRLASDPADHFRSSLPITLRLWRAGATSAAVVSGAPVTESPHLYKSWITRLTGGVLATDLDAQPIGALAPGTVIEVKIAGRGLSWWSKEPNATSPVTDTEVGLIRPADYNNVTMPYVLVRQAGY